LRDILKKTGDTNTPDTQTYFENMSEAYASLCSEYTWVMVDTLPAVNEKGIWGKIEKPTLQKTGNPGGQVDRVSFIVPGKPLEISTTLIQLTDRCLRYELGQLC
jgi:hypothetical protein